MGCKTIMKRSYASLGEGLVNEVDVHRGELVSLVPLVPHTDPSSGLQCAALSPEQVDPYTLHHQGTVTYGLLWV